jgi:hypothetical protein
MMVRLRSSNGWISIREVIPPILLKLVKARIVRQDAKFSIFSSSVIERKMSADNHSGHPWGGERESAKKTGLRLPPPCRGLWEVSRPRLGTRFAPRHSMRVRRVERHRKRWCGDRTLNSVGRAEPLGAFYITGSIEKSTDTLTLHKRTSR